MTFVKGGYKLEKLYCSENINLFPFLEYSPRLSHANGGIVNAMIRDLFSSIKKDEGPIDLSFSPDKSISILAFLSGNKELEEAIIDAHEESVKHVYKLLRKEFLHGVDGKQIIPGEELELDALLFTHYSSRNNDPQLHSHLVLPPRVYTKDGQLVNLEKSGLYISNLINFLYNEAFYNKLCQLGFKHLLDFDKKGNVKINGIDNYVLRLFSKRKAEIDENVKNRNLESYLFDEIEKIKKTGKEAIITRKEKEVIPLEECRKKWKNELKQNLIDSKKIFSSDLSSLIKSFSFEKIQANQRNSSIMTAKEKELIKKMLDDMVKKHEIFSFSLILDDIFRYTDYSINKRRLKKVPIEKIANYFYSDEYEKNKIFPVKIVNMNKQRFYSTVFTKNNYIKMSLNVLDFFNKQVNRPEKKVNMLNVYKKIKEFEKKENITLTEDQKKSIIKFETQDFVSIIGDAGTGKTTLLKYITYNYPEMKKIGISHTREAVKQLEKVGLEGDTIERFLNIPKFKDISNSFLFLDEISMVSLKQMDKIVEKIKQNSNIKLVVLGDIKQIPSLEAGSSLKDFLNFNAPDVHLKENIRQIDGEYKNFIKNIVYNQEDLDAVLKKNLDKINVIDLQERQNEEQNMSLIDKLLSCDRQLYTEIINQYMNYLSKDKENLKKSLVILKSVYEKQIVDYNIHQLLKRDKVLTSGHVFNVYTKKKVTDVTKFYDLEIFRKEDKIIFNKPDTYFSIKAGTTGIVKEIDLIERKMLVDILDREYNVTKSIIIKEQDLLKFDDITVFEKEKKEFCIGEKVMFLKNSKREDYTNGEIGYVSNIDPVKEEITINILDKNKQKVISLADKNKYNFIDYAYSTTTMKTQGATYNDVFCVFNTKRFNFAFNEIYVALSRGKKNFKILTDSLEKLKENLGFLYTNRTIATDVFKYHQLRKSMKSGEYVSVYSELDNSLTMREKNTLSNFNEYKEFVEKKLLSKEFENKN